VVRDGRVEHEPDRGQYDRQEEVFYFNGAAALLRKAALADAGSLDPRYFMYYEDLDLSWRLRLRGWKVLYVPQAVVEHEHAASSGEWSPLFLYEVLRNRPLMLLKLAPWPLASREVGRHVASLGLNAARVLYWALTRRQRGPHAARARIEALVLLSWPSADASAACGACRTPRSPVGPCDQRTEPGQRHRPDTAMKVGIYNQFLLTMGGGERHMGMAAEVLARAGHDVEIVTHVPASIDALAARFGLDLPGVRLRTTPLLPFDQLGDLTSEYDLWVNASFMSMVPSRARRSLLLVLFPFPLDETHFGRFKRRLARHIHRELYVPRYAEGFFGPQ
jgi:hypothetical protein